MARGEGGQIASLLHRGEGKIIVLVLAGSVAAVYLIRTGCAGVERTVGAEGEMQGVVGRVDLDIRSRAVSNDRVRIGACSVGAATENHGLREELHAKASRG